MFEQHLNSREFLKCWCRGLHILAILNFRVCYKLVKETAGSPFHCKQATVQPGYLSGNWERQKEDAATPCPRERSSLHACSWQECKEAHSMENIYWMCKKIAQSMPRDSSWYWELHTLSTVTSPVISNVLESHTGPRWPCTHPSPPICWSEAPACQKKILVRSAQCERLLGICNVLPHLRGIRCAIYSPKLVHRL